MRDSFQNRYVGKIYILVLRRIIGHAIKCKKKKVCYKHFIKEKKEKNRHFSLKKSFTF